MRKDFNERRRNSDKGRRIMLYVHGGAYYFGSVDEHRYQMQRHARKLQARVLAPRYRLAPQFPFPCGLQDCLAVYLYLIEHREPSTILLAGDSAGGGMVLSLLVVLRDQGVPLPAGAILLSPWVDLTHSFPSLGGDGSYDYIPAHGFIHKPSMSWPPPNSDHLKALQEGIVKSKDLARGRHLSHATMSLRNERHLSKNVTMDEVEAFSVVDSAATSASVYEEHPQIDGSTTRLNAGSTKRQEHRGSVNITARGPEPNLTISIDGQLIEIKDQIQLYAPNHLLTHPLVSPVLQPCLGGLPPLLIQVGGGELLRDEQIYLAHKAANPSLYQPCTAYLDRYDPDRSHVDRCGPTHVVLQVWDDLCHVAPTLSFTRPAKLMYRSIAQFGAWALARAQQTAIDILDDDDISILDGKHPSSKKQRVGSIDEPDDRTRKIRLPSFAPLSAGLAVGKAGDPLPPFSEHMIRQRIDRHGQIHPLAPAAQLPALQLAPEEIGVIKEGPVRKWMAVQKRWDAKFAREKRAVQRQRMREMVLECEGFGEGERPPVTALAGRRRAGKGARGEDKKRRGWGMRLWALWGSKHDEMTVRLSCLCAVAWVGADDVVRIRSSVRGRSNRS